MPGTLELTEAQVYACYQKLLDSLNKQFYATSDSGDARVLGDLAQAVSEVLTGDNEVHLQANTAIFTSLTPEMRAANEKLKKAKEQVTAIAEKIADAGTVVDALTEVLKLAAKFP
jgi:hypothetical protein